MKKLSQTFSILLILLVSVIMLNSCRKEGSPGKIYLTIHDPSERCYSITAYSDNNPGIPKPFDPGQEYLCPAGTYSYDYYASSTCDYADVHVTGNYILEAEPGMKGGLVRKGLDGIERYYDLNLEYNGATYNYIIIQPMVPVKFDTTYYSNGYPMRVTGTIVFGERPTKEALAKSKLHK